MATPEQVEVVIDKMRRALALNPNSLTPVMLSAEVATGLVDGWGQLEEERDLLRAALGTVLVAMVSPGLLATDIDLERVVRVALGEGA